MHETFAPVAAQAARLDGRAGLVAIGGDGEVLLEHDADAIRTAASVVKIALVMALYADAAEGRLSLDDHLALADAVPGSGVLGLLPSVRELPVRELAALAIAVSDNIATNTLIDHLGPARIAERLRGWGLERSRLQRRMFDLEAKTRGLENVMSPRETAALLLRLVRGECVDRATSDSVLGLLRACQDATMLRRYLPPAVDVANKSGWLERVRNDAGIVWGPRPVIVAAFTSHLPPVDEARPLIGLAGWCAYRAGGGDVPPLPPELSRPS